MFGSERLKGKTALITGGARRLGRETCMRLANSGVNVIVHYNSSAARAGDLVESLRESGVEAHAIAADFEDPGQAEGLVDRVLEKAGALDYIVNSASIFPQDGVHEVSRESLSTSMNVNALAPFLIGRAFAARQGEGCIVNLLDARVVDYDSEHLSYHLSKRLLLSMTRIMASEFAPKIRVNAVAPGLILPPSGEDKTYLQDRRDTNLLGKYGSAEEVVEAIAFLLAGEFITGQVIYVDGGRHMRGTFYG